MNSDYAVVQSISEREQEIFLSLLEGCTNQEIASSLGICEKTVEEHLTQYLPEDRSQNQKSGDLMVVVHN